MSSPDLLQALEREIRLMTGASVLLSEAVARLAGINSTDLECLGLIEEAAGLSAGDLAGQSGLTTGAITGVIDRLERAGYVRRTADKDDRRKVMVSLAPKAQQVIGLFRPLREDMLDFWRQYNDGQISVVLEFLASSRARAESHVARLQARLDLASPPGQAVRPRRR